MNLRFAAARLLALVRKRRLDDELDGEIRAHLEMAELDALDSGLSPEAARRHAYRNFGGIEHMKEDHRDQRSVRWLENVWRDVRYGLAALARDPGFAAITIGLIALGIGANSAMFSILDAVLLRPLPFPEPDRMVRLWETPPEGNNPTTTLTFLDWKRQDIFEALAAEEPVRAAVATAGDPVRLPGKLVSADYFDVFGVKARLGRLFAPGEDQPAALPVVVLSYAEWQSQFAGDPDVLKRELTLDGVSHRIIGVLPKGSFDRDRARFWKPLIFAPDQRNRKQHWLHVIGRLRSGVNLEQARATMNTFRASLGPVMPAWKKDWRFTVDPFARLLVGDTLRRSIYLAFGAVVMVLLIACANVANLVLAKGATRKKEMALRASLGAGRARLIAQLLTESLVVCVLGGLAGIGLAYVLLHAAAPLVERSLPFTAALSLDIRVLGFAAAAVMAVLTLTGLLPSLQISFGKLSSSLNVAARGSSGSGAAVRRAIVIAEVAISVVLICGAALLFKSLAKLQQVDAGVRIDHVLTMSADLPTSAYPTAESAASFYETVVGRLRSVPGVQQASVSLNLPLNGVEWGEFLNLPGAKQQLLVRVKMVDPSYFATLQIPVQSGRGLEDRDRAGAPPVMVINQETARNLSGKLNLTNPVGRTVVTYLPGYGPIPESQVTPQIVGVIRNERTGGLHAAIESVVYVPLAQFPRQNVHLIARTTGDPLALLPGIREAVRQVDPHLPLGEVRTMEQVKEQNMLWATQPTWALGAFAGLAALMAALGLYGVLAHSVTERRREIGIRMALGARPGDVMSGTLRSALLMLLVGLAAGLAGAYTLTRALKSLLFQVSTLDPVALLSACLLMILVGTLAALIPASRAAKVDPMIALRNEG